MNVGTFWCGLYLPTGIVCNKRPTFLVKMKGNIGMHSVGTAADRLAANIIRFVYLIGLFFGIWNFFTQQAFDSGLISVFVGAVMAFALIVHEYLQTRRVILTWNRYWRLPKDERKNLASQLRVSAGILIALLVFDGLAMWQYLYFQTYHHMPLPVEWTMPIQSFILPIFALAASLLQDAEDDPNALLRRAASEMLFSMVGKSVKQWRNRLARAVRKGHNLSPITTSLMDDAGEHDSARRILLIEEGLAQTERNDLSKMPHAYLPASQKRSLPGASVVDNRNGLAISTRAGSPFDSPEALSELAQSNRGSSSPSSGRKRRSPIKLQPSDRADKFIREHPAASLSEIMTGANVSKGVAVNRRRALLGDQSGNTGTEG